MKLVDLVIIGGIAVVGFMLIGGGSGADLNPFNAGAGQGSNDRSGSNGWQGGNNMSGGNMKLPSNIG